MLNETKNVVKTGVVSMGGMAALGAMSGLAPGSGAIVPIVGAGVGLANIGQVMKSGKKMGKSLLKY